MFDATPEILLEQDQNPESRDEAEIAGFFDCAQSTCSQTFDPGSSTVSVKGASQVELEALFSKYQLLETIRQDFIDQGIPEQLEELGIDIHFGLDLLTQMVLFKRTTVSVLVGILKRHFGHEDHPAQACADALLAAAEVDIMDWDPVTRQFVILHEIDPETLRKLELYQYPLPMIEPPRKVTTNRQTGYQTITGSLILKRNHHDDDICLDHINRVNAQALAVNEDVVAFIRNQWRNIDKPKPGEEAGELKKRRKAFDKFDRSSREVIDAMLCQEDGFWLTHKYDKRGRTYSQGYHINYQGNDWCKAAVQFAHAEYLNKE